MGKLKFYEINKDYLKYLQTVDSQVPNQDYKSNAKFFIGIVLEINGYEYFAPISSYKRQDRTNIVIKSKDRQTEEMIPISSIRFSFMVPVPTSELTLKEIEKETDLNYRNLLRDEYRFCTSNKENIIQKATTVYSWGCNERHPLNHCCCKFNKLEQAMDTYIKEKSIAS